MSQFGETNIRFSDLRDKYNSHGGGNISSSGPIKLSDFKGATFKKNFFGLELDRFIGYDDYTGQGDYLKLSLFQNTTFNKANLYTIEDSNLMTWNYNIINGSIITTTDDNLIFTSNNAYQDSTIAYVKLRKFGANNSTIKIHMNVDSELNYDWGRIYKNNILVSGAEKSGLDKDWPTQGSTAKSSITMSQGDILELRYSKDSSVDNNDDRTKWTIDFV